MTSNRHYRSLTRDIYPFIGDKPIDENIPAERMKMAAAHWVHIRARIAALERRRHESPVQLTK